MAGSLFPDHLVLVRPDRCEPGPMTRGQGREKAYAADGIWAGYCDITARGEPGNRHRHADNDSVTEPISGRCRIDHGPDGDHHTLMSTGDSGFCGKGVIHRVQILGDGRCDRVFFRFGHSESVVAVDGPGPRAVAPPQQPRACAA